MLSLAEVLRRHWPAYEQAFGDQILPSHRRAVKAICSCRTPALGGQVYRCEECAKVHFAFHSCNHRACPQCGNADAQDWVRQQKLKLLPVPYYLITFTVPEGLRAWIRSHQKTGYSVLLKESAGSMQDVASRQKYLGAELGFLGVLHTWGRQLQYHPHAHFIVPAGGLRKDRLGWREPKSPDFFLPHAVLAARFRNRFKAALRDQPDANQIDKKVWKQKWIVDVQPAGNGEAALKYVSAYVYRTALGSQRILSDEDGQITFKYKDSEDREWHTATFAALEFIRRFLQHILPRGFRRVRHYGWLSPAAKERWECVLAWLDWHPPQLEPIPPRELRCLSCGGKLTWISALARPPP